MKSLSIILLLLILASSSCTSGTNNKEKNKIDSNNTVATTFKSLSTDSLATLLNKAKKIAEEYKPVSNSESMAAFLRTVPDSIIYSYKQLRIHGNIEIEKYLTLVFLKIYRTHLQCCHQGYELRNKMSAKGNIDSITDPLLYEFNLITRFYDTNKPIEFINSGMAYRWLEKNKRLFEYEEIRKENDKIEKIYTDIDKGVYREY